MKLVIGVKFPDRRRLAFGIEDGNEFWPLGYFTATGERLFRKYLGVKEGTTIIIEHGKWENSSVSDEEDKP